MFESFLSLDFNDNSFDVRFSEPVDPNAFNGSLWAFHSASVDGLTVNFTGGSATISPSDPQLRTVRISFSDTDLSQLQDNTAIATTMGNTYLSFQTGAIADFSENAVVSTPPVTRYQVQSPPLLDATAASLSQFTLDLDANVLTLTFDDIVLASTFNASAITLHGTSTGTDSTNSYKLSGGVTTSSNGFTIVLPLLVSDVDQLRLRADLATGVDNTFLSMTSNVIIDDRGSTAIEITTPALQVSNFIADRNPPMLLNYTFSFEDSTLVLYFTELMDLTSYVPELFVFQSKQNASDPSVQSYALTGGVLSRGTPNTVVVVNLTSTDVNGIKMQIMLATELNNTYLSVSSGAITDTGNNSVVPVPSTDALLAADYEADLDPPSLISVVLDLQAGALLLEFSEAVNAPNIVDLITVRNAATSGASSINLDPFLATRVVETGSSTIRLVIQQSQLTTLKTDSNIATSMTNTFVSINIDPITDFVGLPLNLTYFAISICHTTHRSSVILLVLKSLHLMLT